MKKYKKILIFIILSIFIAACIALYSFLAGKAVSNMSFNYPGLRIETKNINPEEIKDRRPCVICFGDSVTFGWNLKYDESYPVVLENLLLEEYPDVKVINSGIGGNTIADGYGRIDSDVLYYEPDVVVINFGLNDGMLFKVDRNKFNEKESLIYESDEGCYIPQLDILHFADYYFDVLGKVESEEIKVVVMGINPVLECFPLPEDESFKKKQIEVYKLYNEKIIEIGENSGFACINLWEIFTKDGRISSYIQKDCIHPNEEGLELISENVYRVLKLYNILEQVEMK